MTLNADLRAELLRRMERDQAARRGMIEADKAGKASVAAINAVALIDGENLPWLKQVIAESGWPGRSAVGEDGAHAAWLLAQHADRDPAFQRQCLDLLTVAADQGEATKLEVAYLTDRVLLAEGERQEYGTQATAERDQWVPCPLRDPDGVDQRRAAMSLGPLAENLARIAEQHGPPAPRAALVIACSECAGSMEIRPGDPGERMNADCPSCGHTIEIAFGPRLPGPRPPSSGN
jgi:hypothetical protein